MKPYRSVSGSSPFSNRDARFDFLVLDGVRCDEKRRRRPVRSEMSVGGRDSWGSIDSSSTEGAGAESDGSETPTRREAEPPDSGVGRAGDAYLVCLVVLDPADDAGRALLAELRARLRADEAASSGCSTMPIDCLRMVAAVVVPTSSAGRAWATDDDAAERTDSARGNSFAGRRVSGTVMLRSRDDETSSNASRETSGPALTASLKRDVASDESRRVERKRARKCGAVG